MENLGNDIEQVQKIYDMITSFLVQYSFQLLGAIVVLLVGMFIASKVAKAVQRLCENKQIDITLSRFIANIVKVIIVTMIAIICLNMIGISITPLVAAIGAASLGAGLAVQGLLSNYGAGLNIIITRPFIVGDTIEVKGVGGQVQDILLAHTVLMNEDGVKITIPNRHIVGEILHNSKVVTLLELKVSVAYSSDLDQVFAILQSALAEHELVSKENPMKIGIEAFGDSGVELQVRFFAPTDKVVSARFQINKLVWDTLQQHQVEIPYPQREVRVIESGAGASK